MGVEGRAVREGRGTEWKSDETAIGSVYEATVWGEGFGEVR